MKIIDRDIEFYKGETERLERERRECDVAHEEYYNRGIWLAKDVLARLQSYKIWVEGK